MFDNKCIRDFNSDTLSLSHAKMTVDVTKHLISTSLMHIIISLLLMHIILSNTYKNYHHTNHQKIPILCII